MPKKTIFALICGLIFSLGFAPFDQWLLSIISVVVLLFLIENTTSKESFLIGYLFGFGMWLSGISWLYVSIHFHGNISIIGSALLILVFISKFDANGPKKGVFVKWKCSAKSAGTGKTFHHQF